MADYISLTEVIGFLKDAGIERSVRRVQELCQSGKLNAKKVGPHWQVDRKSLEEFIFSYLEETQSIPANPIPFIELRGQSKNAVQRYIFTCAQDHTPVHDLFWRNLNVFANHVEAEIYVAPVTYKKRKGDYSVDSFDPAVQMYLVNNEIALPGVRFCPQNDIRPTAAKPLSGLGTMNHQDWCIFPHPRVALNSIATIGRDVSAKLVMTTGSTTLPNYERVKSGNLAKFHHVIGATLVEISKDGTPFCRQLIADDHGNFQDLDILARNGKIVTGQRVEAITWGDIHRAKPNWDIYQQCWDEGGILDSLKPRYQFFHDLLDFDARNHHRIFDPLHRFSTYINNKDNIEKELDDCVSFLETSYRSWCKSVVVESNHDLAMLKWLKTVNMSMQFDAPNFDFYIEATKAWKDAIKEGNVSFNVFHWALQHYDKNNLKGIDFVDQNGGYYICNGLIECGTHGHVGVNGSRGSVAGFARMEAKMNIGHTHSAQIVDGVYVAGISGSLDQGYNVGASSWSHSHTIVYPNGKRTIITHRNGKWRAAA